MLGTPVMLAGDSEFVEISTKLLAHMDVYDVTARKAHQWTMVALVAGGFVLGEPRGAVPLALAGAIMLAGRFWWPADIVRQFVWRVAEPAGWLARVEREEDHATRRLARVLGGLVWLVAAGLLLGGFAPVAWLLTAAIAIMVALDASIDFCALCLVVARLDRLGFKLT
jgi:Domain of unknown function (DUF4395)